MFTSPNFTTERRGLPEDYHDNRGNSGKNHLDAINKQLLMIKNIELHLQKIDSTTGSHGS